MNKPKKMHLKARFIRASWELLTAPFAILFTTYSYRVRGEYNMPYRKRIWLGVRFWYNHSRVTSGTSWRAHLVMAMKMLELPRDMPGDIVECGCWQGGSTVNPSLICAVTGRKLRVFDSLEGLPPPEEDDPIAKKVFKNGFVPGVFGGTLEQVKANIERYGDISVCSFHQGWFKDTLPGHDEAIAMMLLDVDF